MQHDPTARGFNNFGLGLKYLLYVVTGLYNATQDMAHLGAPSLSVLYGKMLALTLAFVTLAVLLGGFNRLIYSPRLESAVIGDGGPSPCAARLRPAAGSRSACNGRGADGGRRDGTHVTRTRLNVRRLQVNIFGDGPGS